MSRAARRGSTIDSRRFASRPGPARPGFSLLEMVIALVLISAIAAVAVPRFAESLARQSLDAAAEQLEHALTDARTAARISGRPMRVRFDVALGRYQIAALEADAGQLEVEPVAVTQDAGQETGLVSGTVNLLSSTVSSLLEAEADTVAVELSIDEVAAGTTIESTTLSGDEIVFGPAGSAGAGGTVVLRHGSQVKRLRIEAATGAVRVQ